jgi:hypothetical protein
MPQGTPSWAIMDGPDKLNSNVSSLATYIGTLPECDRRRRLEVIHNQLVAELSGPTKAAG